MISRNETPVTIIINANAHFKTFSFEIIIKCVFMMIFTFFFESSSSHVTLFRHLLFQIFLMPFTKWYLFLFTFFLVLLLEKNV